MEYCDTYEPCGALDGKLLINRKTDGSPLLLSDDIALCEFQLGTVGLRPYVRFSFEQKWVPEEMCFDPVCSVPGLATVRII